MKTGLRAYVLALMVAVFLLMGCSTKDVPQAAKDLSSSFSYSYPNADQYEAGDREVTEQITDIDIDYAGGAVELNQATSNTLTVQETANKTLSDEQKVHTWVEGTTLHVRYCASDKGLDFTNIDKRLTIAVPEASELQSLNAELSSTDLVCDKVLAKEVGIDSSSGDVKLTGDAACDKVSVEASAGDIQAHLGTCQEATFDASSGDVELETDEIDELVVNAASGDTSLLFSKEPHNANIEVDSGDVNVGLPETCNLELTLEIDSGDFDSDLPFKKSGDTRVCGTGENKMSIIASSGDVTVTRR